MFLFIRKTNEIENPEISNCNKASITISQTISGLGNKIGLGKERQGFYFEESFESPLEIAIKILIRPKWLGQFTKNSILFIAVIVLTVFFFIGPAKTFMSTFSNENNSMRPVPASKGPISSFASDMEASMKSDEEESTDEMVNETSNSFKNHALLLSFLGCSLVTEISSI